MTLALNTRRTVAVSGPIVVGDNTVGCTAANITLTLPDPTTVQPGKPYRIVDESGATGLFTPIVVLDFAAAEVERIIAPYGSLTLYSTGVAWRSYGRGNEASPEESLPFDIAQDEITQSSGNLRLAYFVARNTEAITKVQVWTRTTPAGATPTVIRFVAYEVASNGDLTEVAKTAHDGTLLAVANTPYQKALQATWNKVRGKLYACGWLIVTGATAPTVLGRQYSNSAIATGDSTLRRRTAILTSLTDLPASPVAHGGIGGSSLAPYSELIP